MAHHYDLHGERVRSALAIAAAPLVDPHGDVTLDVTLGDPAPASLADREDPVLVQRWGSEAVYGAYSAGPDRWDLVVPSLATFEVRRSTIVVRPDPTLDDAGVLPLLLAGSGLSSWLARNGHLCLHASGLEYDGRCVAVAGGTGRGKSTFAALGCAAGAALVADDLLRVSLDDGVATVFRGSTEIRLRAAVEHLAERIDGDSYRTADGRLAVRPRTTPVREHRLHAVVLPRPDRQIERPHARRLSGAKAVAALIECPRLTGWVDKSVASRQFEQLADVAARVPVVEVHVPWNDLAPRVAAEAFDLVSRCVDTD